MEKLTEQDITTVEDVLSISREDAVELGLTIGERNRLAKWIHAEEERRLGLAAQVQALAQRVGALG